MKNAADSGRPPHFFGFRPSNPGWILLLLPVSAGIAGDSNSPPSEGSTRLRVFTDVTWEAGIRHVHQKPLLDPKVENIMPWLASVGAAAAVADFDGDGDPDLYVTNSRRAEPNWLYRNDGKFRFTETGKAAGVDSANRRDGVSMDAVFGDYDNDGDPDLFVAKWGCNILYNNDGNGAFTEVTKKAGVRHCGNANSALFFDYDNDGFLDLLVGNYFREMDLWNLKTTKIMHDDFEKARNGGENLLYHNNGDGTFRGVATRLGLDDTGWALDVGCGDYDNDGDLDCYVANDFGPDRLFRNEGDGTFRDVSREAIGVDTKKGMNVDFGDYNGDGFLDIYVTNITTAEYLKEGNMLHRNNGDGTFLDVSVETGTDNGGWGWGGKFVDFDNDGDLDIFTVNGFVSAGEGNYWYDLATMATTLGMDVSDAANWPPMGNRTFSGYEPSRLFRNEGREVFLEVAREVGVDHRGDGRGIVLADFDGDGDLDIFVANQGQRPALFRNILGQRNHSLTVRLVGTRSNRDAIGARVRIRYGENEQMRDVLGGNGYASQSTYDLVLGLGKTDRVDRLEVLWPSGTVQALENVKAGRLLVLKEPDP